MARKVTAKPTQHRQKNRPQQPGVRARTISVSLVHEVMVQGRSFDGALETAFARPSAAHLESRDRALARLIAVTVLRRHGELAEVLNTFLSKPLSKAKGHVWPLLLCGAAQLLVLEMPPHAVISTSVDVAHGRRDTKPFAKLVNAVLRRVAEQGPDRLAEMSQKLNFPKWLWSSWQAAYGAQAVDEIARAMLSEPALDLSVARAPSIWAETLGGTLLDNGTVRITASGRVDALAGFSEGAWWVQDAAAALPAKLFGDVNGKRVADLCAAPGGKTLQLVASGAQVTAVDSARGRLDRLKANLARTKLKAETVTADVLEWTPDGPFDAVLLDAPCTATGTIRRHPDILHLKRANDVGALAAIQEKLLQRAADLVKPGGMLIYCTCSLQPEEGEQQIAGFLAARPDFSRQPIAPGECGIEERWLTADGDLRTLPHLLVGKTPELSGIDGFFAARLVRC